MCFIMVLFWFDLTGIRLVLVWLENLAIRLTIRLKVNQNDVKVNSHNMKVNRPDGKVDRPVRKVCYLIGRSTDLM